MSHKAAEGAPTASLHTERRITPKVCEEAEQHRRQSCPEVPGQSRGRTGRDRKMKTNPRFARAVAQKQRDKSLNRASELVTADGVSDWGQFRERGKKRRRLRSLCRAGEHRRQVRTENSTALPTLGTRSFGTSLFRDPRTAPTVEEAIARLERNVREVQVDEPSEAICRHRAKRLPIGQRPARRGSGRQFVQHGRIHDPAIPRWTSSPSTCRRSARMSTNARPFRSRMQGWRCIFPPFTSDSDRGRLRLIRERRRRDQRPDRGGRNDHP